MAISPDKQTSIDEHSLLSQGTQCRSHQPDKRSSAAKLPAPALGPCSQGVRRPREAPGPFANSHGHHQAEQDRRWRTARNFFMVSSRGCLADDCGPWLPDLQVAGGCAPAGRSRPHAMENPKAKHAKQGRGAESAATARWAGPVPPAPSSLQGLQGI